MADTRIDFGQAALPLHRVKLYGQEITLLNLTAKLTETRRGSRVVVTRHRANLTSIHRENLRYIESQPTEIFDIVSRHRYPRCVYPASAIRLRYTQIRWDPKMEAAESLTAYWKGTGRYAGGGR